MSEQQPAPGADSDQPKVSPYNLQDFPNYRRDMLSVAETESERADIRQTFDPENAIELQIMAGSEVVKELSPGPHEKTFDTIFPALDKVYEHDAHQQRLGELRERAIDTQREQFGNPNYYANHWQVVAEQAGDDRKLANTAETNHKELVSATTAVLKPGATLKEAGAWYAASGALSRMNGAEDMLVYAANLPVKHHDHHEFFPPDMQEIQAANMLMEASMVNERSDHADPQRQQTYEDEARKKLDKVANSGKSPEAVFKAQVYECDLDIRQAGRALAAAKESGDTAAINEANEAARTSQDKLGLLLEAAHHARQEGLDEDGELRGREVELTISWLLRERYLGSGAFDTHYVHQATLRQDMPADHMVQRGLPRQSFDVAVEVHHGERFGVIPIQAKSSKAGAAKVYDPRIVIMADVNNKTNAVVKAVSKRRLRYPGSSEQAAGLANGADQLLRRRLQEKRAAKATR